MFVNEPEIAQFAMKVVPKLWGTEYWYVNTDRYCLKFLKINPGFQCSVHKHLKKDETFIGLMGTLELIVYRGAGPDGSVVVGLHPGKTFHIPPDTLHSFLAYNVTWVMEVSTHHSDDDVVRVRESRKLE